MSLKLEHRTLVFFPLFLFLSTHAVWGNNLNPKTEPSQNRFANSRQIIFIAQEEKPSLSKEELDMLKSIEEALAKGKSEDIGKLDLNHPGHGKRFKEEYIKGLELYIDGIKKRDEKKFNSGIKLLDTYREWFYLNVVGADKVPTPQ